MPDIVPALEFLAKRLAEDGIADAVGEEGSKPVSEIGLEGSGTGLRVWHRWACEPQAEGVEKSKREEEQ
ncbi:MAG: hypothetical protein M1286_03835 [Candidatus Marsarchaeota archaeon]|nr:hypothetical protein [Candidatus Marsarchaeota archaeon]